MEIFSSFWFESLVKLILGFILAGIIGAERQSLNKPAGFKTHSLIGLSAVLVMLCGEHLSNITGGDASRIPAQLLSGIGFIGAGTILTDGFNVKGLTTASSLLAVACIGLSIGAGFYVGGIVTTVIVYFILSYSNKIFTKVDYHDSKELHIVTKNTEKTIGDVNNLFGKHSIEIKKVKVANDDDETKKSNHLNILFKHNKDTNLSQLILEISAMENILEVEEL